MDAMQEVSPITATEAAEVEVEKLATEPWFFLLS